MKKRLIGLLGLGLLIFVGTLLLRTVLLRTSQLEVTPAVWELDGAAASARLAEALRFQTISADSARLPFEQLEAFLRASFPRVHATLQCERVAAHSLLYTWPGSDPTLAPTLLAAHLDVVPVEPGTEGDWEHPPFAGVVADGFIWGRGAMDDKLAVLGILEAVEVLLEQGFVPRRSVLLAFGHDEEIGGREGAAAIASLLTSRGVQLESLLDEGLVVTESILPGFETPVALVGIAEKGYLTLELLVTAEGGHSSAPPPQSAVGILAAAVAKLEAQPMPSGLDGPAGAMFQKLAPEMPFGQRLAFANLWCLGWLVEGQLAAKPATNALIRTTTAVTVIEGGVKENVLPQQARALVNFRVHPRDSVEEVIEHVRNAVADERVAINRMGGGFSGGASQVSPTSAASFERLVRSIREVFPEALVAPSMMIAATDSRHYEALCSNIYRFTPQRVRPEDRPRIHGSNERLRLDNYPECIAFYGQWIRNSAR